MLGMGKLIGKSTIVTELYIKFTIEELKAKGCIIDGELYITKFKEALNTKCFDIDILNKPLWGEIEELNF